MEKIAKDFYAKLGLDLPSPEYSRIWWAADGSHYLMKNSPGPQKFLKM